MKVPYVEKWRKEIDALRKIALDCDLTEEVKWGKPCFTHHKRNVAIIIPLKDVCTLSFFKGALLKDPKRILKKMGEHTQSGRWARFTSATQVSVLRQTLTQCLKEAIQIEQSGKKVPRRAISDYPVPEELQARLNGSAKLKAAFETLTPGRRKSYIIHISGAKRPETRVARVEKCIPAIQDGRGFNEYTG